MKKRILAGFLVTAMLACLLCGCGGATTEVPGSSDETTASSGGTQASPDDADQTQLYKRCLEILNETAANVYIQDLAEYVVMNPALDGYVFYPLYILDMSTVHYVDQSAE